MCGIAAAFGVSPETERLVREMTGRLKHRGPDESGVERLGSAVLGHSRLSIIDLKTGKQPICNEKRNAAITFNGEVYNFGELKKSLLPGHRFVSTTDTEVILHLFEDQGEDSFERLDGMFAIVIAERDGFVAARDPLGIKPLYYGRKGDVILLASEMKAFPKGTEGLASLPAGHFMVSGGKPVKFRDPVRKAAFLRSRDEREVLRDVRKLLEKAVIKRLIADVPVGVYLSGGLDSSLVASIMKKNVGTLHSFTAGMDGSPDVLKAREASRFIGTKHHELIYTARDMEKALEKVIFHLESFDAPLVRSAIPMYFVSSLAAEHVKVILSGEGADELFAGYSYLSAFRGRSLRKRMDKGILALQDTNLQRADRISMAHGLEARVPFLDYSLLRYSLGIPCDLLEKREGRQEKWILRDAFKGYLPDSILKRPKMKFSVGAGSSETMFERCAGKIGDREYQKNRKLSDGSILRSKEEYYYYRVFKGIFGDSIPLRLVGRTVDRKAGTVPGR